VQQAFKSGWRSAAINIPEVNKTTEYRVTFIDKIILCTCRHFAQESESHDNEESQSKLQLQISNPTKA
jgi:hypothetical protein